MRILALSDLHGSIDVAEEVLIREPSYDVVILGGDITTFGSVADLENSLARVQAHGRPVLAVLGNMDPPLLGESLERLGVSIDGRGVRIDEVGFFGVSAAPVSPLHTPYEIPEEEIARRASSGWKQVRDARWTVFVPHGPPRDTALDITFSHAHVGSTAVRKFIEEHQPDLVVCGHIHEARGVDRMGRTRLINCGQAGKGFYGLITIGAQIEVENKSLKDLLE